MKEKFTLSEIQGRGGKIQGRGNNEVWISAKANKLLAKAPS